MATTYVWNGSSDGDYDVPANFTPARNTPAVDDIIQITQGAGPNDWMTGPASPETIGSLIFSEAGTGNFLPADATNLTVTGAANILDGWGGGSIVGTYQGELTIQHGPGTDFDGTATGPLIVSSGWGSLSDPLDFSGGDISGVDSIAINSGGMVGEGNFPDVQTTVNSGGYILRGVWAGPVTFKSGSTCGHGSAMTSPEFDGDVTFQSGANLNDINADGDVTFKSGTWNLTVQHFWPWDFAGDVYLEGGDFNVTANPLGFNCVGKVYVQDKTMTPKIAVISGVGGACNFEVDMSELPAPAGGGGGMLMPL